MAVVVEQPEDGLDLRFVSSKEIITAYFSKVSVPLNLFVTILLNMGYTLCILGMDPWIRCDT